MKLYDIYKSNIERPINGVVKVIQNDEEVLKTELEEYVVTKELRRHFNTFLNNYEKSLSTPTDKVGVWISGFFGSGKSHFLKILSYLLANKIVCGKKAVDYFSDKFDDPMMFAQLENCTSVPTETILFNVDSKSSVNKDNTAILRVFAKAFYEHMGLFGSDLGIAKFEQSIQKTGKFEQFKSCFEDIHGENWENSRETFNFFEDDIVAALMEGVGMSEQAARNCFYSVETADFSVEQLVDKIKEYISSKGKDFRLIFMVDEIGQYIGANGDLMLNLQTIVENLGSECKGRVWVVVTSQEAVDSITKIENQDFSKIQARFNTRISLSSSSVDEVIKKRILAKNEVATEMLKYEYSKNSSVLKNLLTFSDSVLDLKGYSDEFDFVEVYPFIPYQFKLLQNVFVQIRRRGMAGNHHSDGERSMLSAFQEAAQAIAHKDENSIIPFYLFYNTINSFLESSIRRVIDRCQDAADNNNGIEQYDVSVLKLLYLIRYIDDIKPTVDNITTLMVDNIQTDKITLRKKVNQSLINLVSQNYVSRNGDTYMFLTDDEQDIEREIRNIPVDSANIIHSISQIIFGDLYVSKKFKYGKYDFPYDQFVDETSIGQTSGSIRLRIVTAASDLCSESEHSLIVKSSQNEAILVLSDNYPYFEDLKNAQKIHKYAKTRNISNLPEHIARIIHAKKEQATAYEMSAKNYISSAILESKLYVAGDVYTTKCSTVKEKIETALSFLVKYVYTKLSYIEKNFETDSEIINILTSSTEQATLDGEALVQNPDAVHEIGEYLELQELKNLPTSMGDIHRRFSSIPYGWREIDIVAAVSSLISIRKISLHYCGSIIPPSDKYMLDYLRKKSEIDKSIIKRRIAPSESLIKRARVVLKEYFNVMDVPSDEDGIVSYVLNNFKAEKEKFDSLLSIHYHKDKYPQKDMLEKGISLFSEILSQKKDNTALLEKIVSMEDDLLDFSEDSADVLAFFKNQKSIFDMAWDLIEKLSPEAEYLQAESEAVNAIYQIRSILKMPKPYKSIALLPDLVNKVQSAYSSLLEIAKQDVYAEIQSAMAEIHQTATIDQKDIVAKADEALLAKKQSATEAETLTQLDAMKYQIPNIRQRFLKSLVVEPNTSQKVATTSRNTICVSTKLKNEADIDDYVADIKAKLLELLGDNDVLNII